MPKMKKALFRETPGVSKNYNTNESSAIFYYRSDSKVNTTISFLNYWKMKRQIDVHLMATLRRMNGDIVLQEEISFDGLDVINYSPNVSGATDYSVEIVASSDRYVGGLPWDHCSKSIAI